MRKTIHCIRHGQSTFNAALHESRDRSAPFRRAADGARRGRSRTRPRGSRRPLRARPHVAPDPGPPDHSRLFARPSLGAAIRVECRHREHWRNSCDVGRSPAAHRWSSRSDFGHLEDIWWHRDGEPDERGVCVEPRDALGDRVEHSGTGSRRGPSALSRSSATARSSITSPAAARQLRIAVLEL